MRRLLTITLAATLLFLTSCRFLPLPNPTPNPPSPDPVFIRVNPQDLPLAIQEWAENSRSMHLAHTKDHQGRRYILAGYGEKPSGGYRIEIEDVVIGDNNITVTINHSDPQPGTEVTDALTYPQDIVYIVNLDLPLEFNPTGAQSYVPTLIGIAELPAITAQSTWIKVFSPGPDSRVPASFTVEGVANVFEGAISCQLRDPDGRKSQEILATAGMGDWHYFQVPMEVPADFGSTFTLELFTYSAKDGSIENLVEIPLILDHTGN